MILHSMIIMKKLAYKLKPIMVGRMCGSYKVKIGMTLGYSASSFLTIIMVLESRDLKPCKGETAPIDTRRSCGPYIYLVIVQGRAIQVTSLICTCT